MPLGLGLGLSPVLYRGAGGYTILADGDDGHERLDTNALNTASVVAGDAGTYLAAAFWRFTGIAVPIGSTITSATVTVTSTASGAVGTAVIRAQKSASPAAVSAGNLPSSWTGASGTTATTVVAGAAAGVNVYDVTDIVQELVDQAGWPSTGGAMNFRMAEDAGGFSTTFVDSPAAGSAVLHISVASEYQTALEGDVIVDFAQQSLTNGVGTAYSNSFGSYTAARAAQTHESSLSGTSDTLTATGWEGACTANTTPATGREMRYRITFSTPLDMSAVQNFVLDIEYPQEMLTNDFGAGVYLGARVRLFSGGTDTNSSWQTITMFGVQGFTKTRRDTIIIPATNKTGGLWSTASGAGANFSAITHVVVYMYTTASKGGMRFTLRRLLANRVGRRALVAFTFDDNQRGVHTYARSMFSTAGLKAGVAVISSTAAAGVDSAVMWGSHLTDLYNDGWAMYNHMVYSPQVLEAALSAKATAWADPGTGGRFYVTTTPEVYADAVVGHFYEIRNSWGPETMGTRELLAKSAGNTLEFSAPAPPYLTGAGYPFVRMDWPEQSRATRIANHVQPCTDYLAGLFGAGYRGRNVFIAPQGDYDVDWAPDLAAAGFDIVRNTITCHQPRESSTPWYDDGGVPVTIGSGMLDLFNTPGVALDNLDNTVGNQNALKAYVDRAIAGGHFLHFYGHRVETTHGALQTHKDLLQVIVTYVADKVALGQVRSVTLDEVAAAYPY